MQMKSLSYDAQLAVDGQSNKYPQFKGNVTTVYTHPLSQGEHQTVIMMVMHRLIWTSV